MKRFFIFSVMATAVFSCLYSRPIKQAKDTIEDTTIVLPESMTANLADLLHDWQIDFAGSENNCDAGQNVVYHDTVYSDRLYRLPSEMELSFNHVVRSYIEMYSVRRREQVAYMLTLGDYYFPLFEEMLDRHGLPLELKYLPVIESALNPVAVSRMGATGLWQFMLKTGQGYGLEVNSLVDERRDPYKSTEAAVRYLKDLYSIYGDWNLVIAAYNCGPGNVNKAIARSGGKQDYWEIYYRLPRETRGYVPAFIAANYIMNYYAEHNICPMKPNDFQALDTVHVNQEIHFGQISEILDIPVNELQRLNPQFKRDIVPGNYKPYALVLPTKKMIAFIDKKDEILNCRRSTYFAHRLDTDRYLKDGSTSVGSDGVVYYRVKKGDNLSKIAKRNGVTVAQLKSWNNLKSTFLSIGKQLIVRKDAPPPSSTDSKEQYAEVREDSIQRISREVNQYYRVKKGDTLGEIAKKNGVTVSELKSWNGLSSSKIAIGEQLIVGKTIEEVPDPEVPSSATVTEYKKDEQSSDVPEGSNVVSEYLREKIKASGKQKADNI
ncbi:MAG: LysM peptidoglycan-binding domain-containing protein [Dysgonamonadaceae bacterium]